MPVQPTYPGVYVEEIPSGVRTITGVATSVTAFVGRALRGPVSQATVINSFADFERVFGGLWVRSSLGYAVRDFYLNGGSQAVIVRLFGNAGLAAAQGAADAAGQTPDAATPAEVAAAVRAAAAAAPEGAQRTAAERVATAAETAAAAAGATRASVIQAAQGAVAGAGPITRARLTVDALELEARHEGAWGNGLRARVDYNLSPSLTQAQKDSWFNLAIRDGSTGQIEQFRNLTMTPGVTRSVDRVLRNESRLVQVRGALPADAQRPAASANPQSGQDPWATNPTPTNVPVVEAGQAVDGSNLTQNDFTGTGMAAAKQGLYALDDADIFNLLCIPPYLDDGNVDDGLLDEAVKYCKDHRALLLVDPHSSWTTKDAAKAGVDTLPRGEFADYAAFFFPRLRQPNPLRENQVEEFVPCGAVAGVFARTDTRRGVWKAPAGLEATLIGVPELAVPLSDPENGELNPLGVNCLRTKPAVGRVIWGSRTLQGDDRVASEWKYIPVRRLALFIEESLYRGTQWVVFEPNDEPLWAQIRLNVGAFMQNLFRQGAFQGRTPRDAYLVKCDRETTTQNDVNLGIVNIVVGFAPLKPAEFVIIKIQQLAGQIQT
jgi:phage tail sheath protein FI